MTCFNITPFPLAMMYVEGSYLVSTAAYLNAKLKHHVQDNVELHTEHVEVELLSCKELIHSF